APRRGGTPCAVIIRHASEKNLQPASAVQGPQIVQTGFEEAADGLGGASFVTRGWLELRRPLNRTGLIGIAFHTQFADIVAHRQRGYFHAIAVTVMLR